MKILVINGPNLNMLGSRDPSVYGLLSIETINQQLINIATKSKIELSFFQSNHEGALIDFIQNQSKNVSGILINPGALTHYGYSLADALADAKLPIVEVHLSDITKREAFRSIDVLDEIAAARYMGKKEKSYIEGLEKLISIIK